MTPLVKRLPFSRVPLPNVAPLIILLNLLLILLLGCGTITGWCCHRAAACWRSGGCRGCGQTVFVKVWNAWEGFDGNDHQRKAWLMRITRNATVDAARKRNLRRMAPLDVYLEERTEQVLSSSDFEGDAVLARLHAAVSTLPPKQRWVFQARYFDDRSYVDLSLETGTSEGALKASYHHARKKLETILKREAALLFH